MTTKNSNEGETSTSTPLIASSDMMAASIENSKQPVDTKSTLLFFMFYVLGTISFVPQNFYITANDYWMYKFRDVNVSYNGSDTGKTDLQKNFTAYYSNVSSVCMVTFLILTIIFSKRISLQKRVVGSLSIMLSMFIVTLIFVWTDTDSWQYEFFILSLVIGALITASAGSFLISVFQLSSKFPAVYLGAQLSGQSMCGILAALTQIFTLLLGVTSKVSALIYFAICASLILGTMVFYLSVLHNVEYFQIQLNKEEEEEANQPKLEFSQIKTIARKLSTLMITMVLTSGGSVIIHPGVTSLVESMGKGTNRWSDVFFVPVCTFLSYNAWDFIGRELSLRWIRLENIYLILLAGVLRLAFIPMLMLCNAQPRSHLPVVFQEDYYYIIFIIIFAITTGYFMNLCVMLIPGLCEPQEMKIATALIVLVMVVSLGACSFLGSVMVNVL